MKQITKHIYLLLFISSLTTNVWGQDPYFSQYFMSPLTLNPALTGKDISNWRIMMNHRTQWWGGNTLPYQTSSISIEKRILRDSSIKDQLSIGIMAMNDASGGGILKNNTVILSSAYNNALNETGTTQIGIGLSLSYTNRMADASKFQFQSQFGSMGFNRAAPINDPIVIAPSGYLDINLGVHYSHNGKKSNHHIGLAIFHAGKTQDGMSLQDEPYRVPVRYVAQMGLGFTMNNLSSVQFGSLVQLQGSAKVISVGGSYRIAIQQNQHYHLNLGLWKRLNDAIYPYIALEGNTWKVGLSYDAVSSSVKSHYQSVQSMEIGFSTLLNGKKERNSAISILSPRY